MEWNRTNTLALASQRCAYCHGLGLRGLDGDIPCDCVFRAIFRICYKRYVEYSTSERWLSQLSISTHCGPNRRGTWGRKEEEYMADFNLTSRRELDDEEHRIFRFRFLLGADWRLCQRKLGMDRGTYFNLVYRIMKKLGRAFAEVEPYPLFPLSEYFYATDRSECSKALHPLPRRVQPIRPPVKELPDAVGEPRDSPVRKCA